MKNEQPQPVAVRKPYVAPAVERVVLDPIKEMLQSCPSNLGGKATGVGCTSNFS